jgi:leucyl/phenylalanyl-tRNA---protein transferase
MSAMIAWLEHDDDEFPDTRAALTEAQGANGLLAASRELSVERLRSAYRRGIFPWAGPGDPVLWWTPDPRMVLEVQNFKLSRSLRKTITSFLRTPGCAVRMDDDFEAVIQACAQTPREGQSGTWIVPELIQAYGQWHHGDWTDGGPHCVSTWMDGQRVGGLYAVQIGNMVFGESMFAHRTDASKIALAALVARCRAFGLPWIDCQQETAHLASLGAQPIARPLFEAHLRQLVTQTPKPSGAKRWTYDPSHWVHLDARLIAQPNITADTTPTDTTDETA